LNYINASLIQSNNTLLWMCSLSSRSVSFFLGSDY
jgi:hypothetical protein